MVLLLRPLTTQQPRQGPPREGEHRVSRRGDGVGPQPRHPQKPRPSHLPCGWACGASPPRKLGASILLSPVSEPWT